MTALEEHLGNITKACEATGISRQTYYSWIKKDLDFAAEIEAARFLDKALDEVEHKLMENILSGKEASIFFFLKCKGKSRGWQEKDQEAAGLAPVFKIEMVEAKRDSCDIIDYEDEG